MPEIMIDPLATQRDYARTAFRVFALCIQGGRFDMARKSYEPMMAKLAWCTHDVLTSSEWNVIHAFQAGRGDE